MSDDATDGVPELTRFEAAFLEYPVVRDVVVVGFLVGFFGGFMTVLTPIPPVLGLAAGVAFAVFWLVVMAVFARWNGSSMLRSVGDDPYASLLE